MPDVSGVDRGTVVDWGSTSADYSAYRPNYPDRFFQLLASFGVGLQGQHILDLGTGVGFLALKFAQQGAAATGVDVSDSQIKEARLRGEALGLAADFRVAPAEDTGLPAASWDVVTASQAWHYFDTERVIAEVKRLLKPDGLLVTSHFCWLPREDSVAQASERLILQHNPRWAGADLSGEIPFLPKWSLGHFRLHAMFVFDEAIPFSRKSWRGRIRACRGIGATLNADEVEAFDREHDALLGTLTAEHFSILHRIDAHIMRPIR